MEKFNYILDKIESQTPSIFHHSERVAMMCYEFSKKFDIEKKDRGVLYMAGFYMKLENLVIRMKLMYVEQK